MADFRDRCAKAVNWLRANQQRAAAVLPFATEGITARPGHLAIVLKWAGLYEQGGLGDQLAEAYVLKPIRRLYREVERGDKGGQSAQRSEKADASEHPHCQEGSGAG